MLIIVFLLVLVGIFRTLNYKIEIVNEQANEKLDRIETVLVMLNIGGDPPQEDVRFFFELCDYFEVDPYLANAVLNCESTWDDYAKNPNSSARGYFQFIDSTWDETLFRMNEENIIDLDHIKEGDFWADDQYNGQLNLMAGIYLLSKGETRHWESSRQCWARYNFQREGIK